MTELSAVANASFAGRVLRRLRREGSRLRHAPRRFNIGRRIRPLRDLTDRHAGSTAVVVGMGPSLRQADLDRLGDTISFGCNKVFLAFDKIAWRPTYYNVCDILVAQNNREAILAADFGVAQPIHNVVTYDYFKDHARSLFYEYRDSIIHWRRDQPAEMRRDLSQGVMGGGYSVVIDQIQMAYAMGCTKVYLVGVDFSFSGGEPNGATCKSGEVLVSLGERNHFHQDYRKPGETWTVPKLQEMFHAFDFCRAAFEQAGRKLYNASRQTALTAIERVDFDEVFPDPARGA